MKSLPNNIFFEHVETLIDEGEKVELKVKGGSMRPYLRSDRDIVVIGRHEEKELKRGAIVLFRYRGSHILHRIVHRSGQSLTMSGDGTAGRYEKVQTTDVVAIVRRIVRPGGKMRSPRSVCARIYICLWQLFRPLRTYMLAVYDRFMS